VAFNPNQPRDPHGRFGEVANALGSVASAAGVAAQAATSLAFPKFGAHINPLNFRRINDMGAIKDLFRLAIGPNSFTDKQRGAIETYVHNGHDLNYEIRNYGSRNLFDDDKENTLHLDRAILKSRLPFAVKLYRGIAGVTMPEPGGLFTDRAYISTSFSKAIASSHALANAEDGTLLHIYADKGKRALPLDPLVQDRMAAERETLLPRNSRFRVLHTDESDKGLSHAYLELL
jgi:hypothetical protein